MTAKQSAIIGQWLDEVNGYLTQTGDTYTAHPLGDWPITGTVSELAEIAAQAIEEWSKI